MKVWGLVGVVMALFVGMARAQAPAAPKFPPGTPMANATTPSVGELIAMVKTLQTENQKLKAGQPPAPPAPTMTPEQQKAAVAKILTTVFTNSRDQALGPCHQAGGTLAISLDGKGLVSAITCTFPAPPAPVKPWWRW